MKIGLTYDLRADYLVAGYSEEETAEFDRPDTIEAIEGALRDLGHEADRIGNIRQLVIRLAVGERWDLVFNVAEGLRGASREAQVPAILEAYEIPCTFSDPLVSALTLDKAITKRVLRDLGVPTADFRVVESEADVRRVDLPYPLFVKPLAEGTAKGIDGTSKVDTPEQLTQVCRRVLNQFRQPALVEVYLSGREFTVGVTGTGDDAEAVGTMEIILRAEADPHSYTYRNKEECEVLCDFPLAEGPWGAQAEELALAAWRGIGCRDAGRVDLRADADDRLHVMEINPLPGLHPTHSDLPMLCTAVGIPYLELIRRIVESASKRVGPVDPRAAGLGRPTAHTGTTMHAGRAEPSASHAQGRTAPAGATAQRRTDRTAGDTQGRAS